MIYCFFCAAGTETVASPGVSCEDGSGVAPEPEGLSSPKLICSSPWTFRTFFLEVEVSFLRIISSCVSAPAGGGGEGGPGVAPEPGVGFSPKLMGSLPMEHFSSEWRWGQVLLQLSPDPPERRPEQTTGLEHFSWNCPAFGGFGVLLLLLHP